MPTVCNGSSMGAISSGQSLFNSRSLKIDYQRVDQLFHIGSYRRYLSVSLTRMMENAFDWEHLPFIHAATFHDIVLVEEGDWGWRAEVGSTKSKGVKRSALELLVDMENHYWATTVVSGVGKGIEIHTKARAVSDRQIEIEVKFYSPDPVNWFRKKLSHVYLKNQYRNLYDEDNQLMQDRQAAIDDRKRWRQQSYTEDAPILVGAIVDLEIEKIHVIEAEGGRYCVAFYKEQWLSYSAVCPHQLGNLDDAKINQQGHLSCPWHGYRFDVRTGEQLGNNCTNLQRYDTIIKDGQLFIKP